MGLTERRARAHAFLDSTGAGALILQQPANFAWYTGGGDNRVDHSSPIGVAAVVITRDREMVLADNIEADRMAIEQVPQFDVVDFPWFEGAGATLRDIVGESRVVADGNVHLPNFMKMEAAIARLRWVLDNEAIERYQAVGKDTSGAMEDAAAALIPGMTEIEAAAEVAAACRRRGLFAPVILAAGDDRIGRFRHPVSSSARFHRRAMLVVCAERGGTYANMTQFVHFEEPDRDWLRQRDATETILRRLREEATKPGRSLGEIFADAVRYYREAGFPDEWMHHHQGGMTGYATREVVATPESDVDVQTGMAFAWNPSVQGAKSEETFVLTGGEPVVLAPVAVSGATTALW